MEKITYTQTIDGEEKERYLVVKKPNSKILTRAQVEASHLFADLVSSGKCILRSQLDDYMERVGLWSDEKQKELEDLQEEIRDLTKTLSMGGIKLSQGRANAIKIKELRGDINSLLAKRNQLDNNTIEGQCDNLKLDYIIFQCIYDEEGNRVFKDVYEYRDNTDPQTLKASNKVIGWIYGINENAEKNLPENKFLLKYGFINEDLRFIDKEGRLTDVDGRLVDKDGRYINESGEYVDAEGNRVDDDGELILEFTPFIED